MCSNRDKTSCVALHDCRREGLLFAMIGVKYLQDAAYHGLGLVDGEQRELRIRLKIEPSELSV
jgi:hypothetical protein